MKIAVASQNRKAVTGHSGKCRKFWVYEVDDRAVTRRTLLELPIEQSFHAHDGTGPHPLADVQVLISGGMGSGLVRRLAAMGIECLVTAETDPDRAVAGYLAGTLPLGQPEPHAGHHHDDAPHD